MTMSLLLTWAAFTLLSRVFGSANGNCSTYVFSDSRRVFESCEDLPVLSAHLHWTYLRSTKRVQVAYRASQSPGGWVAWAVNPTSIGMIGAQAIVAFRDTNGTMAAYTSRVESYAEALEPGKLSFGTTNVSAEYREREGEVIVYAVVGPFENGTSKVNQVWQEGRVKDGVPQMHSLNGVNLQSMGEIDFLSS
ncbi:hypothetical protein MLD38_009088 [Melastoma candidum]|uniref:Uncharacterized protein n=1 Tax=Melastoma candidum TaxID=119954 RepID=A0ACB9RXQ6_9MYRT|nr:hypothetical protein MLD38_009088 [Melastoma candidum]